MVNHVDVVLVVLLVLFIVCLLFLVYVNWDDARYWRARCRAVERRLVSVIHGESR